MIIPTYKAIYANEGKSDRNAALILAELAWMKPALLHPIEHGSEDAQIDLLATKYPQAGKPQQINGVGPVTSLSFVLINYGQDSDQHAAED